MLGSVGPLEIGIVLVLALLVFGPKRLPELGKSVGNGIRELRDSIRIPSGRAAERLEEPPAEEGGD